MEDEEHVLFHCPAYDICCQEYPELFWGTNMNMKNISDSDNQDTIAQLLWDIRRTRIKLGVECRFGLMWFCYLSRVFVFSISQVLVGSTPLKPYGFDKGCKHSNIYKLADLLTENDLYIVADQS